MTSIADLDSQSLANRITELVGHERNVQADFLLHLMEFDRRRDYLTAGYPSLWEYVQKKLGYPENATFRRTHAVRVLHRFPPAIDHLRDGRLSMTTLVLLEPALTEENAVAMFAAASGRSKRQVEEFLASLKAPGPAAPATIRKVPEPPAVTLPPSSAPAAPLAPPPVAALAPLPPMPAATPPPRRASVDPVSANQYRISMVVSGEFVEALREAQLALSHAVPSGDVAEVLRRGLAVILEKHGKRIGTVPTRKHTLPPVKKSASPTAQREPIPAAVRRKVWRREGGRCTWPRPDGGICGSRYQLELDHIQPCAQGGASTEANLRLRCAAHNGQHAREIFGGEWIDRVIRQRRTFPGKGAARRS